MGSRTESKPRQVDSQIHTLTHVQPLPAGLQVVNQTDRSSVGKPEESRAQLGSVMVPDNPMVQKMEIKQKRANLLARAPVCFPQEH